MDQRVALPPFSMLVKTPVYKVGDDIVTGLMVPPVVPDPTDTLYTVTIAGERRLDLLSAYHYGTPELWWVLATVNGLMDPIAGVLAGSEIRVPLRARLASLGILNI